MTSPTPQSGEDAAYAAIALFDALIDNLLKRQIIRQEDLNSIGIAAVTSLKVANNGQANRAADFVGTWVASQKEVK